MSNKARNTSGKFAAKSETPRKIRSVNLTDHAWQWLAGVATKAGVSRNDYLELLACGDSPLMETVESQTLPLMETVESDDEFSQDDRFLELQADVGWVEQELLEARADYAKLLESSTCVIDKLRKEVQQLRSQLATERADREEVEAELSDLRQKSVTASQEFPEPADLLNQLKGRRKKSRTDLVDIEVIIGLLNQAGSSL